MEWIRPGSLNFSPTQTVRNSCPITIRKAAAGMRTSRLYFWVRKAISLTRVWSSRASRSLTAGLIAAVKAWRNSESSSTPAAAVEKMAIWAVPMKMPMIVSLAR